MKIDLIHQAGPMALGSRFRQVSERLTQEAATIYESYGLALEPRWFLLLYALMHQDAQSVTQLAERIGQSQASVSQTIQQLHKQELVTIHKADHDGRKTIVALSDKARELLPQFQQQIDDVSRAVDDLLHQMQHNIWQALDEIDYWLDQQSLSERVKHQRRNRESSRVQIVPYQEHYQKAFQQLNEEWITTYFAMEEADYQALNDPQGKIISPGGCILMALYDQEPVGCCALIKRDDADYELAKMAVSPQAQGKHIGWLLGRGILEEARQRGARKVYLESNTRLKAAIGLYHKLGFQRIQGHSSPYQWCNIHMELTL